MTASDMWFAGYATALAEMHRSWRDSSSVAEVAKRAGLTLGVARKAGVSAFDLCELRRAGIR